MELSWNNATNANAGYEYRYTSNQTAGVIWSIGQETDPCPTTGTPPECTWREASKKADDTDTIISGLTLGTTYYFQVRSKHAAHGSNEIQESGPSNTANALQRAKPPAVENLAATAGNAQVTLTWTHLAAYDIISYIIQREGGTGGGTLTPTTEYEISDDKTEATYTVSNLVNGTEYSFQVKGRNFIGIGPDLEVENFVKATPSGPLAAPRDLTAQVSSTDGTTVKLTWADPEDSNIDEYQYRVRVYTTGSDWDPPRWTTVPNSNADTTTYTVEDLISVDPGYEFQVRALDTDRDEGDRAGPHSSVTGTPTTLETAPEAMTNVRRAVTGVIGGAGGMVTFTWADPGDESIDKYQYRYDGGSSNPDVWDKDWTDVPTQTIDSIQVPNNKDLTVYSREIPGSSLGVFFELRAVNNGADEGGGPATAITVERSNTPDSPTTPGAPVELTASAVWDDQSDVWDVTLTWPAAPVSTVIDKYQYRQSVNGGSTYGNWTDIDSSSGATIKHRFEGVTAGTVYVFKLRGVDTGPNPDVDGVPATSNQVTPGTPSAPTELKTTDRGGLSGKAIAADFGWVQEDTDGVTVSEYQYRYRVGADATWDAWAKTTESTLTTDKTKSEATLPPLSKTEHDPLGIHFPLEGGTT